MEEQIADFLKKAKPSLSGGVEAILNSKDLFKDGWLDSLLNLQLLAFVEKTAGVKIPTAQVTRKNFQTVSSICAIAGKARG